MPCCGLQTEWAFCFPDWLGLGLVFEFRNFPPPALPGLSKATVVSYGKRGSFSSCPWSEIRKRKCIHRTVASFGGLFLCHHDSGEKCERGL